MKRKKKPIDVATNIAQGNDNISFLSDDNDD